MSDRAAMVVALAAAVGAWWGVGPTPGVAVVVVAAAFVVRRPWLLPVGVLMLTGGLAARAEAGLTPPIPAAWQGWVTLLTDAEPVDGEHHDRSQGGEDRARGHGGAEAL